MDYQVGDRIVSKKKHPCGNDVWSVTRVGADFKIKCEKCGHTVMLERQAFLKMLKKKA
jgi:hypothetical protein